jgi:hypothetical protein
MGGVVVGNGRAGGYVPFTFHPQTTGEVAADHQV